MSTFALSKREVTRTLRRTDALHGLVVHATEPGLNELVTLEAQIQDLGALDGQLDELLLHLVHDIRRGLHIVVSAGSRWAIGKISAPCTL